MSETEDVQDLEDCYRILRINQESRAENIMEIGKILNHLHETSLWKSDPLYSKGVTSWKKWCEYAGRFGLPTSPSTLQYYIDAYKLDLVMIENGLPLIPAIIWLQDIKHDHEAVLKYYKMSINEQGIPDVQLLTKARGTQSDKRKEVTENDSSVKKRKYMQEQSDVLSIENEKLKETVRSQAEEIVRLQQESLAFREENVKLKAAVSYKQEENAKLHQELASSREEYTNLRAENSIIRCKRLMPVIEKPRLENYNPKDYNDPQKIQQNEVFIKETLDFCLELAPNLSKHVLFLDSGIGRTTLEFMKHPVTDLTFHIPNDSTSYEQLKQLTREYKNVNVIQTELSMILSSAYFTDSQYLVAAWLDGTSAFKKLLQNFEAILASYHAILPEGMVLALTWTKHGNDKSLTPDVCMNTLKDTAQKYSATFYPSTTFPDFFPKHYRRIIFVLGRLVFDQ